MLVLLTLNLFKKLGLFKTVNKLSCEFSIDYIFLLILILLIAIINGMNNNEKNVASCATERMMN